MNLDLSNNNEKKRNTEAEQLMKKLENYIAKEEIEKRTEFASVDRIEGNFVVCELENGNIINVKKEEINFDVKSGDILVIQKTKDAEINVIRKDEKERERRLNLIREKLNKIRNK